jgi:uncharacterized protein YqeY
MLEQQLDQDLKAAMLSKDSATVETIRGLKSALLYAKVAAGTRDQVMPDDQVIALLAKEAKKRQESIDLYQKGGDMVRADKERQEKAIIERYLPAQLGEEEISQVVDEVLATVESKDMSAMGKVIAEVKQRTQGAADGAVIARIVKQRLQ